MEQKQPLQQMVLGDLDRYVKKKNKKERKKRKGLNQQLTPYTEIN